VLAQSRDCKQGNYKLLVKLMLIKIIPHLQSSEPKSDSSSLLLLMWISVDEVRDDLRL